MDIERQKRFLIGFLYLAVVLGIAVFVCRSVIPALLPFVIAFVVSMIVKPAIRFLRDRCHVQKNAAGTVLVVVFYSIIGFLIAFLSIKIFAAAKEFIITLPGTYALKVKPFLNTLGEAIENLSKRVSPQAAAAIESTLLSLGAQLESAVASLATKTLSSLGTVALGVPNLIIDTIIAVVATVFIAVDWEIIRDFCLEQMPEKTRTLVREIARNLGITLKSYIRSYALILFITFCELSVGFLIIGIDNPFGIAAPIAMFDILPVVGTGTVLIPWTVIALIMGNYGRCLSIFALYLTVTIIRNIIEPKIVGNKVGLHPIVTLLAMVVGTYVFGPIGLLGLPIALAIIVSLNSQGIIHLYERTGAAESSPAEPGPTPSSADAVSGDNIFSEPEQEGAFHG